MGKRRAALLPPAKPDGRGVYHPEHGGVAMRRKRVGILYPDGSMQIVRPWTTLDEELQEVAGILDKDNRGVSDPAKMARAIYVDMAPYPKLIEDVPAEHMPKELF